MPNSIKKDDIKKPGSLLRWLFVQTNDEVEQKRLFDKYLGRFKNYYSASLGKNFSLSSELLVTFFHYKPNLWSRGYVIKKYGTYFISLYFALDDIKSSASNRQKGIKLSRPRLNLHNYRCDYFALKTMSSLIYFLLLSEMCQN